MHADWFMLLMQRIHYDFFQLFIIIIIQTFLWRTVSASRLHLRRRKSTEQNNNNLYRYFWLLLVEWIFHLFINLICCRWFGCRFASRMGDEYIWWSALLHRVNIYNYFSFSCLCFKLFFETGVGHRVLLCNNSIINFLLLATVATKWLVPDKVK